MSIRAWQVQQLGEAADVLTLVDAPEPTPGPGQVRVRVRASAVNFADTLLCKGEYRVRPDPPFVPGMEVCGDVLEVGADVTHVAVGDRVLGGTALPHGGYASECLMEGARTFPAPAGLDDAASAALMISYQTGWFGLHRRAALREGETLLVHAASGGVGSAAVQLGKAAGARVIGVVGGADKVEIAERLGCDVVIDRKVEDIITRVKEVTDGRGADVVYDPVGGPSYTASTKCIAFEGRIVVVGFASGRIPEPRLNHAMVKNYSILGLHLWLYEQHEPESMRACHADLVRLADAGQIEPLVAERFDFEEVPAALTRIAGGSSTGRIVVTASA
ncbi:NADPH:quinone oxidoreductase family protein [Janibacter limosus]|uniref:NADPH:quinone oxidoreductase family protein n=1 Tax=Janibacter limosus TaxID=53458 RepID=A0AC61U679_9MICO|nr:NADPH:quinone oxidoreductase family protein [Janibacter limosus]UUZ45363.1 NADPH:quinone oxidoreductase family protein [Janibacter limosus]